MSANLEAFTRRLEECRRRWNHRSLEYVLQSARILAAARTAAKDERRWVRWLREGPRMNRSTAMRHLRVSRFMGHHNVALTQHFEKLSIAKIYSLSRTKPIVARRLAHDERIQSMSDVEFARHVRGYLPPSKRKPTTPNLFRSIMSGLEKVSRGIARWQRSRHMIPPGYRVRIRSRLRELLAAAAHVGKIHRRAL